MSSLMATLRSGTDVILVQEADIAEANVVDVTAQAAAAGDTAVWSKPTALSKDGATSRGRIMAILVKNMKCHDISRNQDATTQFLIDSGRWVERMIPVDNGKSHIIVASMYGISGASSDQSEYEENERIIMAAMLRMSQMGSVPYFIGTDVNIDPSKSEAIQKSREAKIACDIVFDAYGGKPPPTFCRNGAMMERRDRGKQG